MATQQDVEKFLLKNLGAAKPVIHKLSGFNHNDFLWGLRARAEVYQPILEEMQRKDNMPLEAINNNDSIVSSLKNTLKNGKNTLKFSLLI